MDFPVFKPEDYNKRVVLVDQFGVPIDMGAPVDVILPDSLITSGGIEGNAPRLRVDPGQTGFFAGRMFRAFFTGVIPTAGPSVQFRFTAPVDFILWTQELSLTQGALQLEIFAGATSSGIWTEVPSIGLNRMSERPQPYYESQCVVEVGGDFSGGTRTDLIQVRTAQNNQNAANVGGAFSERGLPSAVFHGRLSTLVGGIAVNDPAQYVYQLAWEEREA